MGVQALAITAEELGCTDTNWREFKSANPAEDLQFEKAALLRDQIKELKHMLDGTKSEAKPVSYRKSRKARG